MTKYPLPVDAAYFFDFISILSIKYDRFGDKKVLNDYVECADVMKGIIGEQKFNEVTKSKEYQELYDANNILFDMVDLAKDDKVKASDVDSWVLIRWNKKVTLQSKFFPEVVFGEKKYGYKEVK